MPRAIQRFVVSLKAAIVRDRQLLLLREADTGFWELPGGRIDEGEEWIPQAEVLAREIAEELGGAVAIAPGPETVTWVRQRPADGVFQLLVVRLCRFESGDLKVSPEHCDFAWTTPADWADLEFPPLSGYRDGLHRVWAHLPVRADQTSAPTVSSL